MLCDVFNLSSEHFYTALLIVQPDIASCQFRLRRIKFMTNLMPNQFQKLVSGLDFFKLSSKA